MKNIYKNYVLVLVVIAFGFGFPSRALSEKWENIPEKYRIETLKALYEKNEIKTIFERCSEGIQGKALPDKYKSILYMVRAKTYIQGQESISRENAIKAGLDCVKSNHLDPDNFSCVEVLQTYVSMAFVMSHQPKAGAFTDADVANATKMHQKIKSEFLTELEQKARAEKIEGVDAFFKKLPQKM